MMMETNKEIERRWLLKKMPDLMHGTRNTTILQYYVEEDGKVMRYRSTIEWGDPNADTKYFKTSKVKLGDGEWDETEGEITEQEFNKIAPLDVPKILKSRFYIEDKGLTWELDNFLDMDVVILEVELDDINQPIEIPEMFKELIIMEVTGIDEFQNSRLAW